MLVSRVRTPNGVRLLRECPRGRQQILRLQFRRELAAWNSADDSRGCWCDDLARRVLANNKQSNKNITAKGCNSVQRQHRIPGIVAKSNCWPPTTHATSTRPTVNISHSLFAGWASFLTMELCTTPFFTTGGQWINPPWLSLPQRGLRLEARIGDVFNPRNGSNPTRYHFQTFLETLGFVVKMDDGVPQQKS